jgi:SPP1 gp7 family putative phage head morphogenesis protein
MDFMEQKKFSREEILGIWRAPKALFNITEDLNYATFIGQMKIFWSYAIMPVMRKVEGAINKYIVWPYNPKIEAYFDYSNVVAYQEDFKEKVVTAVQLSGAGFTRNEINERLQLGFDNVAWGDVWWAPFGLYPVSSDEAPALSSPGYDDPKGDEDKKTIAQKTAKDERRDAAWKAFLTKQGSVERGMSGMVSKFFFEQRKTVLAALNEHGPESFKIDWNEQNEKLQEKAGRWIAMGVKEGITFGRVVLGKKSLEDDRLNHLVSAYVKIRTDKITGINDTVRRQIFNAVKEGAAAGETVAQIGERIRTIYNMASSRSLMIARTETVGAVNGGSQIYYESEGVQKKEWLTARDENVRDSHRAVDGQVVAVKASFSNGLDYPGDQKGDPGESINCRCTLLPVLE